MENINKLNELIGFAACGKIGYQNAADNVEDLKIKRLLFRYSRQRAGHLVELRAMVRALGGDPDDRGASLGNIQRTWRSIKAIAEDDNSIVNVCIKAENTALDAYNNALGDDAIFGNIKTDLSKQVLNIEKELKTLKANVTEEALASY